MMGLQHLAGAFVVYKTKFLYEMIHVCVFVHETPNLIRWSVVCGLADCTKDQGKLVQTLRPFFLVEALKP